MEKVLVEENLSEEEVLAKALTDEEKKQIVEVFSKIPITGNIQSLPAKLELVFSIIKKLS